LSEEKGESDQIEAEPSQLTDKETEQIKDDFIMLDKNYLDGEVRPLSHLSDFTRVNPLTASSEIANSSQMIANFLIGP